MVPIRCTAWMYYHWIWYLQKLFITWIHIIASLPFIRFQSLWKLSKHLINRPENCVYWVWYFRYLFLSHRIHRLLLIRSFPSPPGQPWLCGVTVWLTLDTETWLLPSRSWSESWVPPGLRCLASDPHSAATNKELSINRCNTAEPQGLTLGQFNGLIIGS